MILDFMKKKNHPLENRHFYEQFFTQQDKAEKIQVLEMVSDKINTVLEAHYRNPSLETSKSR